jgi:hypothetical protein
MSDRAHRRDKAFPTTADKLHSGALSSAFHPDSGWFDLSSTELPFRFLDRMFCSCLFLACSVATRTLACSGRVRMHLRLKTVNENEPRNQRKKEAGFPSERDLANNEKLDMTLQELRNSLRSNEPPEHFSPALAGLWWDAKGDWTRAHESAQRDEGPAGAWVHAYLHRKEGDQ